MGRVTKLDVTPLLTILQKVQCMRTQRRKRVNEENHTQSRGKSEWGKARQYPHSFLALYTERNSERGGGGIV